MTKFAGLIGDPIAHSRSPAMHNAAFSALGIDARYDLWPTTSDDLAAPVASLRRTGILGANVTIPHKLAVMPMLDTLAPSALEVGAVNTIVPTAGKLSGHNTDGVGLAAALQADGWLGGDVGIILGSGGAARGAVVALRQLGVERIALITRNQASGQALADTVGTRWGGRQPLAIFPPPDGAQPEVLEWFGRAAILINTTPIGSSEQPGMPIAAHWLDQLSVDTWVVDLIVARTALIAAAAERRHKVQTGVPMLVYQGALAFTLWIDQPAPIEVMRAAAQIIEDGAG